MLFEAESCVVELLTPDAELVIRFLYGGAKWKFMSRISEIFQSKNRKIS